MKAIWLEFNLPRMGLARLIGRCNRAAFWGSLSSLRFGERAEPGLPTGQWVRCRTILGGICGSDLTTVTLGQPADSILRPYVSYPMMLGHENLAEVVEVGGEVDRAWLGRRVCVEPTLNCTVRGIEPRCRACQEGRIDACANFDRDGPILPAGISIGYNRCTGGSWSEFFVAHRSQLFAVPDGLADEAAALTDALACSLHGVLRARPRDDEQVLVVGAGIIGLGVVAGLRATGCRARVTVDARHGFQADAASRLGADQALSTGRPGSATRFERLAALCGGRVVRGLFNSHSLAGGGFDVVFDCVGSAGTIQDSLRSIRGGGKLVLLGATSARRVDWTAVWARELTVLGAYGRQTEDWAGRKVNTYQLVLEMLADGRLKADGLLTHKFPLADYARAFAAVTDKKSSGVIKAAFEFGKDAGC